VERFAGFSLDYEVFVARISENQESYYGPPPTTSSQIGLFARGMLRSWHKGGMGKAKNRTGLFLAHRHRLVGAGRGYMFWTAEHRDSRFAELDDLIRMQPEPAQYRRNRQALVKLRIEINHHVLQDPLHCAFVIAQNARCQKPPVKDGLCGQHWAMLAGHRRTVLVAVGASRCGLCGKAVTVTDQYDPCPKATMMIADL